jgi:Zn-dependent protease with chaperone function
VNAGAVTLHGQYYDGRRPIGTPATLVFAGRDATLVGAHISQRYTARQLLVSPRVGRAERFIALPDGGQFQCADQPVLNRLPHESQSEGLVAWLEKRLDVALASVAIIVSSLLAAYFVGLPAVAKHVAAHIPIETEQAVGQQALAWLDDHEWFKPTRLEPDTQNPIRNGFAKLYRGLPLERYYRLEFRASFIGANALALPGGTIVITDDMVHEAETVDEVLAVLAHEIGHMELRHTMRHVLQDSAVAVVAATLTADAASLSVAVAGLPALLAQARYSRAFEAEADDFSFTLLKRRDLSPAAFAAIMERLAKKYNEDEHAFAFMATHPVTAERVKHARAAANGSASTHQPVKLPKKSKEIQRKKESPLSRR